jgi:Tfp pilus assembly protein PilO
VAEQQAFNASISAGGAFGNTKGSSETNSFSVTYEFDLGNEAGKKAFEAYCKNRLPPPMPPHAKWIDNTTGHLMEDHDVYKFAHIGEIGYQDTAWQQTVVDETGTHSMAGGGQSHKVKLNWVRHLTFDENVHSETEITGRIDNGNLTGFGGQMTVGGESGSYNRKEFGKIFSGAKPKAGVEPKNSGEWTLSANIDKKMFEQLEQVNDEMRRAKTREEKLKIYSELAKKGGAQMLSGQVRGSGQKLAWNLELKGDPNFPGAAGREQLNALQKKLTDQLKAQPATAGAIAAEAKDTVDALTKRLAAVSDESKYTDLPDELRNQQKDLIKDHLGQFKALRSKAISATMRGRDKEDLTDTLKRAATGSYNDVKKENREVAKLRDRITIHETEITVLEREITGTFKVLGRMFMGGQVKRGEGVKAVVYGEYNTKAKTALASAKAMDERLKVSAQKARELRDKYSSETDPTTNEATMRALVAELKNQLAILDLILMNLRTAAREAYVITSDAAIGKDWNFWKVVKVDGAARANAISGLTDDDL